MEVQGSFCMGDKVRWILALLFLVLVLIGIRSGEYCDAGGGKNRAGGCGN